MPERPSRRRGAQRFERSEPPPPESSPPAGGSEEDPLFLSFAPGSLNPAELREREERKQQERRVPLSSRIIARVTSRLGRGGRRRRAPAPREGPQQGPAPERRPPPAPRRERPPSRPAARPPGRARITQRFVAGARRSIRSTSGLTGRLSRQAAGRFSSHTGRGALQRTQTAFRLAQVRLPRAEREQERLLGFLTLIPGACVGLLAPAALLQILGATLMLALAGAACLVSPRLGLLALVLAFGQLAAFRLRRVRETSEGRDHATWPDWDEAFGAVPIYLALALLFVPAAVAALVAWGPAAWDREDPASLPAQVARLWEPSRAERALAQAALEATQAYAASAERATHYLERERGALGLPEERPRGDGGAEARELLAELAGAPGEAEDEELEELEGPPLEVAARVARSKLRELFAEVDPRHAAPAARVAWLAAAGALFLFPMALLAATKLDSPYAVFHLPLLLRSVLSAPVSYLLLVVLLAAQDLFLVVAVAILPAVCQAVLPVGSGVAVAGLAIALAVCALPFLSGSVLGRFYRARRLSLHWEHSAR